MNNFFILFAALLTGLILGYQLGDIMAWRKASRMIDQRKKIDRENALKFQAKIAQEATPVFDQFVKETTFADRDQTPLI
jgi:hypothetical protein